jgi:hypothetical protein
MLLPLDPALMAVTVTMPLPPEAAVTPVAALQSLIAAMRFAASVVVILLVAVAKVPEVELGQLFVPSDPPLTGLHEYRLPRFDPPTVRKGPAAGLVTVNVLPDT